MKDLYLSLAKLDLCNFFNNKTKEVDDFNCVVCDFQIRRNKNNNNHARKHTEIHHAQFGVKVRWNWNNFYRNFLQCLCVCMKNTKVVARPLFTSNLSCLQVAV